MDLFSPYRGSSSRAYSHCGARGEGSSSLAGGLLYTVYTFVIYALGMHFNAMFLVYCAALGTPIFALTGIARSLLGGESTRRARRRSRREPRDTS